MNEGSGYRVEVCNMEACATDCQDHSLGLLTIVISDFLLTSFLKP